MFFAEFFFVSQKKNQEGCGCTKFVGDHLIITNQSSKWLKPVRNISLIEEFSLHKVVILQPVSHRISKIDFLPLPTTKKVADKIIT